MKACRNHRYTRRINVNVEKALQTIVILLKKELLEAIMQYCVDSYGWWKTVSFEKGTQLMDGETA
jgi:hypothetical protein